MPIIIPHTQLHTDYIGDGDERAFWSCTDMVFHNGEVQVIVPANAISDGLSIPRIFQNIFSKSPYFIYAGMLHDYCYAKDNGLDMTRKEADKLFSDWMQIYNVPAWKRKSIWLAVRVGGWRSWRKRETQYYEGDHK